MSTLYIGPSRANCSKAHSIFQRRIALNDGPILIANHHVLEKDLLAGPWFGTRAFFMDKLPALRAEVQKQLENREVLKVHVDIGDDLSTLYAAYYANLERVAPVSVTLHTGHDGVTRKVPLEDGGFELCEGVIRFGGELTWAVYHPLVVRKLALTVLQGAREVWVTDQDDAKRLFVTYPTLEREILGAPLTLSGSSSGA